MCVYAIRLVRTMRGETDLSTIVQRRRLSQDMCDGRDERSQSNERRRELIPRIPNHTLARDAPSPHTPPCLCTAPLSFIRVSGTLIQGYLKTLMRIFFSKFSYTGFLHNYSLILGRYTYRYSYMSILLYLPTTYVILNGT